MSVCVIDQSIDCFRLLPPWIVFRFLSAKLFYCCLFQPPISPMQLPIGVSTPTELATTPHQQIAEIHQIRLIPSCDSVLETCLLSYN